MLVARSVGLSQGSLRNGAPTNSSIYGVNYQPTDESAHDSCCLVYDVPWQFSVETPRPSRSKPHSRS